DVYKRQVYILLCFYLAIVVFLFFRYTAKKIAPAIVLGFYSIVYALVIIQNKGFDKKIHFIEYGILTYLAYTAVCHVTSSWNRYALTLCIATLVGFADEAIQHFSPGRSFDLGDFVSNLQASVLMLVLLYIVEKYRIKNA
ncbi:MAG: VanZ family protein, partial [Spirochaetes bacterium]|nr:VanZ family protein [Spirochaetota bacterium]